MYTNKVTTRFVLQKKLEVILKGQTKRVVNVKEKLHMNKQCVINPNYLFTVPTMFDSNV